MPIFRYEPAESTTEYDVLVLQDAKLFTPEYFGELERELIAHIDNFHRDKRVDFRNVQFADSHIIGVLYNANRRLDRAGRPRLKLTNLQPGVMQTFAICKTQRYFDFDSESISRYEQALAA